MSKINPKKAYASEIFDGFNGIGADQTLDKSGMLSMRNFRILPDGSIQKRCGWSTEIEFDATLRGYWSGELDNTALRFVAVGSRIYRLDQDDPMSVCTLTTNSGMLKFFIYRGYLYALDGARIYCYSSTLHRFVSASGYVPLYGKEWHPTTLGLMNESLNLLNKRIRIHYRNTIGTTVFKLPFFVSSLDRVRLDGTETNNFTLNSARDGFSVTTVASSVEICCTILIEDENEAYLRSSPYAYAHQDGAEEQLLLYGSAQSNLVFSAAEVTPDMLSFSRVCYSDSDPLYFSHLSVLPLGDAEHPITSICRHRGRFLAFHKDGAYSVSVSKNGSTVEAYPLLKGMGCRATDAIVHLNGDPVVINASGVFALHAPTSDDDDFRFECLSASLPELRAEGFAEHAITAEDHVHGELWFATPDSTIYVFNIARRQWYTFQGIEPSLFLRNGDRIGFGKGRGLCFFDESLTTDDGAHIIAYFQTEFLAFGYPEVKKRALRFSLCADPSARATVDVSSENADLRFTLDSKKAVSFPTVFDRRLSIGRFNMLRITLNDSLGIKSRYYRLALFANV